MFTDEPCDDGTTAGAVYVKLCVAALLAKLRAETERVPLEAPGDSAKATRAVPAGVTSGVIEIDTASLV